MKSKEEIQKEIDELYEKKDEYEEMEDDELYNLALSKILLLKWVLED